MACDILLSLAAFAAVVVVPVFQVAPDVALKTGLFHSMIYGTAAALAHAYTGSYRSIWRFVGFRDILVLLSASGLTVIGYAGTETLLLQGISGVPLGLFAWTAALLWVANTAFLILPRVLARMIAEISVARNSSLNRADCETTPVLVTGDVARIEAFVRDLARSANPRQRVLGVLANDPKLFGSFIQGVPVLGSCAELQKIADALAARQGQRPVMLVLAKDDATRQDFTSIVDLATEAGMKAARLAPVGSLQDGHTVKPIELTDLLGRPEVSVDLEAVGSMIRGKRVFVTGAGGSIGCELCRQIARLEPAMLIIADKGEFNLYAIDKELQDTFPGLVLQTALVDVRDRDLVERWIARTEPDLVFHAAALKHVPLLEEHPIEAVRTNVLGTMNVADACVAHGVPAMVTVSTDKAVNPCNVMGATKRLAEAYCQGLDQMTGGVRRTRFVTVRFGNVLGSTGSVVPLFQRQIESGGPVTVTHPDVVRYFMTIPEAVTLILQAGANGIGVDEERGSIYVLDMGKPVKIVELARQMISLSGYRADVDIEIAFVGLRPGEKLYEELAYGDEAVEPTLCKSILKLTPRTTDIRILQQQLLELRQASVSYDRDRVLRLLQVAVPEYIRGDAKRSARG